MILTYHHIGKGGDENWVSVAAFKRQMRELSDKKVVRLSDYDPGDPSQMVITFDDGGIDIMNALPILKKHGYPFEVFVVGDWFETGGYIGAADAPKIIAAGGRLEWHTKTHRKLTELSDAEIESELSVPPEIKKLDPDGFGALAYPYWVFNDAAIKSARGKFACARSGNGFANLRGGVFALDSIKIRENTNMKENKDKIVKYIELVVPTWPCNFRCHYCYVGQHCTDEQRAYIEPFRHSPEEIARALSVERVGGAAIVNFCAHGETLILPQNLEYIKAILGAGHFVMIVSNMTPAGAIGELLKLPPEQLERLFFKCSFHWLELKRLNLLQAFADNVNRAWKAGASITVEITPSDELEPEIPEIKKFSLEHFGALPHITVARDENRGYEILTKHTKAEYEKIWGQFDSPLFDFKMSIWGKKIRDFCYAGDWSYSINMATGDIFRCSSCGNIGNLFPYRYEGGVEIRRFPRYPAAKRCPFPHCYNGHFWATFGMLPDVKALTYAETRDRIRKDGTHWVYPRMLAAFRSKAETNNRRHCKIREWLMCRLPRRKH